MFLFLLWFFLYLWDEILCKVECFLYHFMILFVFYNKRMISEILKHTRFCLCKRKQTILVTVKMIPKLIHCNFLFATSFICWNKLSQYRCIEFAHILWKHLMKQFILNKSRIFFGIFFQLLFFLFINTFQSIFTNFFTHFWCGYKVFKNIIFILNLLANAIFATNHDHFLENFNTRNVYHKWRTILMISWNIICTCSPWVIGYRLPPIIMRMIFIIRVQPTYFFKMIDQIRFMINTTTMFIRLFLFGS